MSQPISVLKKLMVSGDKIFYTIQGEGVGIGRPAVFLRLALCNLKCKWCDTKYSWDSSMPEYAKEVAHWSVQETISKIREWPVKRLVITGGEPLLQQELLLRLCSELPDWEIEIETNGTIVPDDKIINNCQLNISPKLSNSGNDVRKSINEQAILKCSVSSNCYFKFVVSCQKDITEIKNFVKRYKLSSEKIIIMPEGVSATEMIENTRKLVEEVKKTGWRVIPRLHIILWGNKRRI